MKKITSLLIAVIMLTSTAYASPVVEKTTNMTLICGVEYKNIKGLYPSGWQDIHVVTADLNEEHLSLEILKNKNGESYMEKTTEAAQNNDTVVAVNGDFFAAKRGQTGRGSAIGVEIRDGKLYSSASVAESMNTLYKVFNETGFNIDAFTFDITFKAANGLSDKIKLINKYDDLTGIVMYTSDWAESSVGSVGGIIEVSVDKDGTVLEKVTESDPIKIPEGGYVLSAHMSYNTFLLDNVNVGDKVSVDIQSTPDYQKIETAVGGGGVLVRNGVAMTSFSHNIGGKNPRTAIGLDKTGKKITLVVLDGRRTEARGMTQTELAELMVELGCYSAINFDGGGSSIMVIDEFSDKKTVNTPSDGAIRTVTNSIGIVSSLPDDAPLKEIVIDAPEYTFSAAKTNIEVYGIDEYERKVKLNGKITYETDNGVIDDGVLIPDKSGEATIKVASENKTATKKITVLDADDPNNRESQLSDEGYRFSVFGNTKNNETMFNMFVMNRATIKMKQSSDFQFFLGGAEKSQTLSHVDGTYYMAKEYSCINKNGDTFITLPNESSYIYQNDISLWSKFINDIKNSSGNLFVFLDRNFISDNETEKEIFKNILKEQAKNRTVYVFGGGFVNGYSVEDNVRYVNTAGFFESVTLEGTSTDYVKYLLVTVNGTDVTYEYKQAVK